MDKLGTSHIVPADMLVALVTVYLAVLLYRLPPNTFWARALAALCGAIVVATPFVMVLGSLGSGGAMELSMVAIILCFALWRWHQEAKEENAEKAEATARPPGTRIHV